MCWGDGGWMWGGGWLTAVMTLTVFVAMVITGTILATRYLSSDRSDSRPLPTMAAGAEDVLAHQFARGEIDETEFVKGINALKGRR